MRQQPQERSRKADALAVLRLIEERIAEMRRILRFNRSEPDHETMVELGRADDALADACRAERIVTLQWGQGR